MDNHEQLACVLGTAIMMNRIKDILHLAILAPILLPTFIFVGAYDGAIKYYESMKMWLEDSERLRNKYEKDF